jgi:hypothetical protein
VIISAIVRSGAFPLFANQGALGRGDESLGSRYFKPLRGIVLHEAMKRHCIKFGVLIDPCVGSGNIFIKHIDDMAKPME